MIWKKFRSMRRLLSHQQLNFVLAGGINRMRITYVCIYYYLIHARTMWYASTCAHSIQITTEYYIHMYRMYGTCASMHIHPTPMVHKFHGIRSNLFRILFVAIGDKVVCDRATRVDRPVSAHCDRQPHRNTQEKPQQHSRARCIDVIT